MYYLKCRRVTETENISTATSKNGRLMRRGQCVTCEKTKTQFIKRDATGGSFLNTFFEQSPFRNAFVRTLLYRTGNKTLQKIEPGWNSKGLKHADIWS